MAEDIRGIEQCEYCHGIGACPKCWGRAGYDRLTWKFNAIYTELLKASTSDSFATLRDGPARQYIVKAMALCKPIGSDGQ